MYQARIHTVPLIALIGFSLLFGNAAHAAGFGGYLSYSKIDGGVDNLPFLGDQDYESDRFGLGFVMDTNVAKDSLFNYRLEVGYQHSWREFDDFSGEIESDGFTINNTFGFAPYRNENVRLWMGPALRLSVDVFDEDDIEPLDDWVTFGGGIGPAVGLNWHMGSTLSGSLSLSYQYMFMGEYIDFGFDDDTFDGHEHLVTFGLSVLFRSRGDRFGDN
jgi:hypothetical protein